VTARSLYKARGVPTKQPVCAICVDRTRGRTTQVEVGYGVCVWLCETHASPEFRTFRAGRDFVLTLQRIWQANGCLTAARHRALDGHLAALKPQRRAQAATLPGSYAWPAQREAAERAWSKGATLQSTLTRACDPARYGDGRPPSRRTVQRWRAQRRWLSRAGPLAAR
jgi:hypothetical protein